MGAFDDVIHEVDGVGLGVFFVNLQRAHPSCIANRSVLETVHLFFLFAYECRKINTHFDVVRALDIQNDPHWPEMVFAPKIKHLFLTLGWRPVGMPFRDGRRIDQARYLVLRRLGAIDKKLDRPIPK
jgi:hypothetical protein